MARRQKPPEELWCIHNRRYDLTEFSRVHPGGNAILLGKGRNCTELFESYHSLSNGKAQQLLEQYFAGSIARPGDPDYRGSDDV